MRKVLIVLAASTTASLASASQFSTPMNSQAMGSGVQAGTVPTIDNNGATPDTISPTQIPAPGTAVVAVAGLAMLTRRRRDR